MKNINDLNDLEKIKFVTKGYLNDYLSKCYEYNVSSNEDEQTAEINIRRHKNDNLTLMLRLGISYRNREIYIYNIFIPLEDRGNGLGMGLIYILFNLAKVLGNNLVLHSMTDSFYNKMLSRGALTTNLPDCLVVTDDTILK
jgi:hypothetical protein